MTTSLMQLAGVVVFQCGALHVQFIYPVHIFYHYHELWLQSNWTV